jgi:uncharacterized membrane protein
MVTTERSEDASRVRVVIEPNQSLTWRESLIFFAAIALLSLAVALAFSLMGYWPILPFAGLELAALAAAIYVVAQRGRVRHLITITAGTVRVEKGRVRGRGPSGGPEYSAEFPRAWVRVDLVAPRRGWYPSRLLIGASGRSVVVGEFLTDEERQELKGKLLSLLVHGDSEAPPPPQTEFE